MEQRHAQDGHDAVWQAGLDALAFTGGGAGWAMVGLMALFPRGGELVPVGVLLVALLVGASRRCLHAATRPFTDAAARPSLDAGAATRRAGRAMLATILGIAVTTVACLQLVPPAQVISALALVSGIHCLALGWLGRSRYDIAVGVALGGLALTASLLALDQAVSRTVVGIGGALVLWGGAVLRLRHASVLVARAHQQ